MKNPEYNCCQFWLKLCSGVFLRFFFSLPFPPCETSVEFPLNSPAQGCGDVAWFLASPYLILVQLYLPQLRSLLGGLTSDRLTSGSCLECLCGMGMGSASFEPLNVIPAPHWLYSFHTKALCVTPPSYMMLPSTIASHSRVSPDSVGRGLFLAGIIGIHVLREGDG